MKASETLTLFFLYRGELEGTRDEMGLTKRGKEKASTFQVVVGRDAVT